MKRSRSEQVGAAATPQAAAQAPVTTTSQQLPPHTLRLLRLVLSGTAEHAAEAAVLLQSIASTSSSPTQLWDILGRLQQGLTSREWHTRRQAAEALQGVARQLPHADHVQFLTQNSKSSYFLTVQDLSANLDTVLSAGRPLLASSSDRYNDDDAKRERELKNLDGSASQERKVFLERRIKLQRRILAERLGLSGLGHVLGEQNVLDESIMTYQDVDDATRREEEKQSQVTSSKRPRRDTQQREAALSGGDEEADRLSVRALLMMQIEHEESSGAAVSHQNPQQLLATELVYRMFDPAWHVRHGALLGALSLLRAWKANASSFGAWPGDVLARCLCILGLDRFGDFSSGALVSSSSSTATSTVGGVVAPVREVAGQLLAVLFAMVPPSDQMATLEVLFRLCKYESEWEPRHGAMATFKFILIVLGNTGKSEWYQQIADKVAHVAIRHLGDDSDDVQSAAAVVVRLVVTEYYQAVPSFILEKALDIILSIKTARSVSACLVDLVELLAAMLRIDARSLVASISPSNGTSKANALLELSEMLCNLLDSDYESVRTSTFHSMCAFIGIWRPEVSEDPNGFPQEAAQVCRRFAEKVFELFFCRRDAESADTDTGFVVLRDEVWKDLTNLAGRLKEHGNTEMNQLELPLLERYFWREEALLTSQYDDLPIYSEASSALASFLVSDDRDPSDASQIAMSALLQSPWIYHCQASCLLYKSLCRLKTTPGGLIRNCLLAVLDDTPVCLREYTARRATNLIKDKSFHDLCWKIFLTEVSASLSALAGSALEVVVDRITSVWTTALQARGLSHTTHPICVSKGTTVVRMRVEALIAGAVVASGLPARITPVVRSLMTSLANEAASKHHQNQTCNDLSLLLRHLDDTQTEAKKKILNKICDFVIGKGQSSAAATRSASNVLRLLAKGASLEELTVRSMHPLWLKIESLSSLEKDDTELPGAARLLRVFSSGLQNGSSLVGFLIDTFGSALVHFSCENEDDLSREASSTLSSWCSLDSTRLLSCAIPVLVDLLKEQYDDSARLSACVLLKNFVDSSAAAASLFVRVLLPVTMRLMTDRSEACSKSANSTFATLVRIAPLAPRNSTSKLKISSIDSRCESVVDHLIFGLPLPPCELPDKVAEALRIGGIELRAYQMEGIAWLRFLQTVNLNGALCDSMGLGKSCQALVAVAIAHEDGRSRSAARRVVANSKPVSLIVCPASVVGHWVREIEKFFPRQCLLQPLCYAGTSLERRALRASVGQYDVVVTSYSVLRADIDFLASFEYRCCILDEGHLLKNPQTGKKNAYPHLQPIFTARPSLFFRSSATAKASKRIQALHKTILTGTPVQNKVSEIWAMFDFLMPNFLGTSSSFAREYARPIIKSQEPSASAASIKDGMTKLKLLHQQVLPFILRREKGQVLRELPPKNVSTVRVPLSDLQKRLYADFSSTEEARKSLDALKSAARDASLLLDGSMGADVLKSILFLRLLCTHPSMVLSRRPVATEQSSDLFDPFASGKFIALVQLLTEAGIYDDAITAADNDTSLLYCDENTSLPVDAYSEVISYQDDAVLRESVDTGAPRLPKSKCLIFSQFAATLDVVEDLLLKPKMPSLRYMRLDGRVPMEKRAEVAEAFNNDDSVSVMLLTTRVGGLGLNLTGKFKSRGWAKQEDTTLIFVSSLQAPIQ